MKAITVTVGIGVLLFGTSLFTRDRPDTRWRNGGLSPMSQEAQRPAHSRASTIPTPALPAVTGSLSITPPLRAEVLPPSRHKSKGSSISGSKPPEPPRGPRSPEGASQRGADIPEVQASPEPALQTDQATEAHLAVRRIQSQARGWRLTHTG